MGGVIQLPGHTADTREAIENAFARIAGIATSGQVPCVMMVLSADGTRMRLDGYMDRDTVLFAVNILQQYLERTK